MIRFDPESPVPPFHQLRTQLSDQIRSGALAPGDQLPTVRRLAADLELAPGTVARAYRELEQRKLIITRGRRGTVVAGPPSESEDAAAAAAALAATMRDLGIARSDAVQMVEAAFDDLPGESVR